MKKKVIWLIVTVSMTLVLLAVSCYSAPSTPPAPAAPTTPAVPATPTSPAAAPTTKEPASASVDISGFAFAPATITIAVGATVTWTNKDSVTHTVTSQSTLFDSGNLSNGATFSYTFNQKGTFEYHCKIHPSMNGKIIVE